MQTYEYKVVPAPKKPGKMKGVKGTDAKFAASLSQLMNQFGAEGWEYQRTDTLPCEERQGFTGRVTTFQNMLIFRRPVAAPVAETSTEKPVAAATAPVVEEAAEAPPSQPVFTFRGVSSEPAVTPQVDPVESLTPASGAETPKVTATKDAPEGNAPEIRFRPSGDQIAAQ